MTEVINTNMPSLVAQRNLSASNSKMATCLQRLSSGLRINSAKDDAAGLSIATRMQSSITGLTVANRNSNDAISLSQIAEGALQETTTILQRARELAVQSANGTNASTDRQALQAEVNQIQAQIQSIATTTSFNGLNLLDGSLASAQFQVGSQANQTVTISIADARTTAIGADNLTVNANDGILQANYETYQESNGSGVKAVATSTNGRLAASTIVLTPWTNSGVAGAATTITPAANSTAAEMVTNITANSGGLAKASAYTSVSFSSLVGANGQTLTLGATATIGAGTQAGPVLTFANMTGTAAAIYSNVATAFNANPTMQGMGCYAIASATDVKVISPNGYDIYATSSGAGVTANMQLLDSTGANLGAAAGVVAGASASAAGILSLEVEQNVVATYGDTTTFNAATARTAGVRTTQTVNRTAAQAITIAGNQGTSVVNVTANQSAASIAVAVNNNTSTTGVSATVSTTATLQNLSTSGTVSFNLQGDNATAVSISAAITTTDFSQLVQSINNISGTTGITAQTNGANNIVLLTNALGNDIKITALNHSSAVVAPTVSAAAPIYGDGNGAQAQANHVAPVMLLPSFQSIDVVGNAAVNSTGKAVTLYAGGARNNVDSTVVGGQLTFTSPSSFSVSSNVDDVHYSGSLFSGAANLSNTAVFTSVNLINISTSSGAQSAISVIDQALNQIGSIRANLGAIQSRFESTMRNLSNNIENLQSAMSRIMDADFAAETANLTKSQILTQAGISILGQANQIPQSVLQLLG